MTTQHLFLLSELTRRDFKGRYAGSVLGFVWSFVQPLWSLVLFTFLFSTVLKISPVGERTDNFAIFLFCGLLPWLAANEGIARSATAIVDSAALVKKMNFPSEVLVLAVVLAALLHEAIAAVVFLVVLLITGEFAAGGLPILLVVVPLQILLTTGIGLFVAALQVFFRDAAQINAMVLQGWFYLTPIVYPLGLVPERYRWVLELNPMATVVGLYREALLGGSLPPVGTLLPLLIAAPAAMFVGWLFFRRLKPAFADEV